MILLGKGCRVAMSSLFPPSLMVVVVVVVEEDALSRWDVCGRVRTSSKQQSFDARTTVVGPESALDVESSATILPYMYIYFTYVYLGF